MANWIKITTPNHKSSLMNLDQIVSISWNAVEGRLLLFDNTSKPFIFNDPVGKNYDWISSLLKPVKKIF